MNREEVVATIEETARRSELGLGLPSKGISEFPQEILKLKHLQALDLRNNQLTTIPENISQLVNLRTLDLRGNQIEALPESIGGLTNLQELWLSGNQLRTLPTSIAQLQNLTSVCLDRNPLNAPLKSAYEAGLPQLMAYLRSLEEGDFVTPSISQMRQVWCGQSRDISILRQVWRTFARLSTVFATATAAAKTDGGRKFN